MSALAASEDISRILEKNPIGNVHSVFNTSFNLAFGEHLVHIGAVENGLAPFGIGMEQANATATYKAGWYRPEGFLGSTIDVACLP